MEKLLIEIKNKQGLHLRPATLIFKTLNLLNKSIISVKVVFYIIC